jgi:drug/metabolite transporter (DMT)-like permease
MALTARPSAASRAVPLALALVGLVLLVAGILYLTMPASSLPSVLPHPPSAQHSVKRGSVAVIVAMLCFLGAWLAARRAGRTAGR